MPVFTKVEEPQYIFQPTFGYLIGFILATFIIGKILEQYNKLTAKKVFIACIVGLSVVYICGLVHMYVIFNFYLDQPTSAFNVLKYGFLDCVECDLVITALA